MMMKLRTTLACAIASYCFSTPAYAYEFENAVPLTVGMQRGAPYVTGVHIKLQGHEVDMAIALRNDTKLRQQVGFYAATPLVESLGEGEEYADKSFPELKALLEGKPLPVSRYQRAFVLGQDVTATLRKGHIKEWQSQHTFGWHGRIPPESNAQANVRYAAMPKFSLQTIESEPLEQLVQQHCGDPDELNALLHDLAPEETQVLAEVFEFPLPLLQLQDTRITIEQPSKRWMGTRQVAALACSFDGGMALPTDGTIRSANHSISILVVSLLSGEDDAQTTRYKIGNVTITEDSDRIRVQGEQPITLQLQPGGRAWPPLQLDEAGRIHAGAAIIDPTSGKSLSASAGTVSLPNGLEVTANRKGYALRHGQARCTIPYKLLGAPADRTPLEALQAYNVKFSASRNTVLALVTSFLKDGQAARYHVQRIDPATCKTSVAARLGDPDLLVELGHSSRGGWWITGAIEQTLLASRDGGKWRSIALPAGLSSLISSYIVDDKQVWLAAILGDMDEYPHLLVYSPDGGSSWTSLKSNDPLLAKIPAGWLEGQRRKTLPPEVNIK